MQDATTATTAAVNSRARTGRTNGHRRSSDRTAECRGGSEDGGRAGVLAVASITGESKGGH
ncbi:hypothetical protein GCM10017688_35870 [Streptomyces ramulosus]